MTPLISLSNTMVWHEYVNINMTVITCEFLSVFMTWLLSNVFMTQFYEDMYIMGRSNERSLSVKNDLVVDLALIMNRMVKNKVH